MREVYIHRAPVRFTHTDPAGYVLLPRFFEMFQAAVEDWFTHCLGLNYAEQILKRGVGFPTARTECDFLRPCQLGETLGLRLVLEKLGSSSLVLRFDGHFGDEERLRALGACRHRDGARPVAPHRGPAALARHRLPGDVPRRCRSRSRCFSPPTAACSVSAPPNWSHLLSASRRYSTRWRWPVQPPVAA